MQTEIADFNKKKRYFFYILMFFIFGWFFFMQLFGTDERHLDQPSGSIFYTGSFTWEKPDGSRESINVPGRYDVPAGTTMVLFTQLPSDFSATSLAIRSSLQDIRFYMWRSRVEYSTGGTRLSGKTSASRYVFCPTSAADAGKELRIELTTWAHQYSGVVNDIYCGDKANIWHTIFDRYELETFIAFFILFAGLATILFSFALGVVYKTSFDMEYLGWCMFMGATWMLGESKLRQIFVSNASSLGALCFVMIQLVPVPILFYADSIQHGQHHRLYTYLGGIAVLNFAVSALLLITGTADYIETLPAGLFILAAVLLTIFINLVKYMHASKSKADRLLLLGLLLRSSAYSLNPFLSIMSYSSPDCSSARHAHLVLRQHHPHHKKRAEYGTTTPGSGNSAQPTADRRHVPADDSDPCRHGRGQGCLHPRSLFARSRVCRTARRRARLDRY